MYHHYFGLQEAPFSIAVNPKYLFMSARHRDALAHLLYGVGAGGGFILLTGEVGTGKTTINRCLMQQLPANTDVAIILNPALNAIELLATVCDELNIDYPREACTLKVLTDHLHRFLTDNHARGRNTVLLIDEAQHLQFEVLEQIRLLTNLETNTRKLLQIILVGQPELSELLSRPELRQLNQRITARYDLRPLNRGETEAYIKHRLQVAGLPANQEIFPKAIVRVIHQRSGGIPRIINVLCDRMLLGAYGQKQSTVDRAIMRQAMREVLGDRAPASTFSVTGLRRVAMAVAAGLFVAVLWAAQPLWRPLLLPQMAQPQDAREPIAQQRIVQDRTVQDRTAEEQAVPELDAVPAPTLNPSAEAQAVEHRSAENSSFQGSQADLSVAQDQSVGNVAADDTVGDFMAPPWYRDRAQGLDQLLIYLGVDNPVSGSCWNLVRLGYRCEELQAATWDEVLDYNRPALLYLVTADRFAGYGVLTGIDDERAELYFEGARQSMPLEELGAIWQGDFLLVWRPPSDFEGPVALGAQSQTVRWLAQAFARLDRQPEPLTDDRFNAALDQRVRLFQRQFELDDDGVVGVRTLLKLIELTDAGPTLQQPLDAVAAGPS